MPSPVGLHCLFSFLVKGDCSIRMTAILEYIESVVCPCKMLQVHVVCNQKLAKGGSDKHFAHKSSSFELRVKTCEWNGYMKGGFCHKRCLGWFLEVAFFGGMLCYFEFKQYYHTVWLEEIYDSCKLLLAWSIPFAHNAITTHLSMIPGDKLWCSIHYSYYIRLTISVGIVSQDN